MIKSVFFSVLMAFSSQSLALVYGGSNLGFGGYSEFSQYPPTPPYNKESYSLIAYQGEVERYVREAQNYVDDANNDIKRIKEAQEQAIMKANAVVAEYNRTVRGY